jgi:hypothetical protein
MYDIVFISYQEPNADENFTKLKERFPMVKRVHGVKGLHQAHINAAKKCFTNMFWVVDADAIILNDFNFEYNVPDHQLDHVHVWRTQNPINDLVYGYGGVKLLPRKLTLSVDINSADMTTSISKNFMAMPDVSNITAFNTDPFNTYKSAFRECAKLSSKVIKGQHDEETEKRLETWCTVGKTRPYGLYALAGAASGRKFGMSSGSNIALINDFDWLKDQFDAASF